VNLGLCFHARTFELLINITSFGHSLSSRSIDRLTFKQKR
jgi:hypothetical protein